MLLCIISKSGFFGYIGRISDGASPLSSAVELGEPLADAARREAREETGLEVEIGEVATVIDNVIRDEAGRVRYHYVIVDYCARPAGGSLQSATDVSDARWFRLVDLAELDMTEKAGQLARELLTRGVTSKP